MRANRAKAGGVTGIDLLNAKKASTLSLTLLLFTAAYLVCVFVFLQ
jgi:hypothetical protein